MRPARAWFKNVVRIYKKKHKPHVPLQDLSVYENYQEELLALSPNT